mmetsp:Transcript_15546/g.23734  ORF Transcript_15546/g.23734 Transcript_15546/m.23734 type:complete len:232 (+) Transcript_15546:3-698(+)
MLELLPLEEKLKCVSELRDRVIDCVEDMHGNHVVQIMVKALPVDELTFIVESIASEAEKMATHIYGCRVLQRIIEKCSIDQISLLVEKFQGKIEKLSMDLHGNYVVQCLLDSGSLETKRSIVNLIKEDLVKYGKSKVGSNVVEKCFHIVTDGPDAESLKEERAELYKLVLDDTSLLKTMATDKFGNYAVQGILRHSRGEDREGLKAKIKAMEEQLQSGSGKHILNALKKLE